MTDHMSVEDVRLAKRAELEQRNGAYLKGAVAVTALSHIREKYADLKPDSFTEDEYTVGGRVMFFRSSGKIAFVTLQAGDGTRLQLMLPAQVMGEAALAAGVVVEVPEGQDSSDPVSAGKALIRDFSRMVDLGDHIVVTGTVCTSIKGELSLRISTWTMASKSIRPLPFLHSEVSDETRVRQPYLDLIQSQDARDRVRNRARIVRELRSYLDEHGYVEVDTPILQPVHGGAQARPFTTHVNALDQEFSLRIALELNLKKSVVGGLDRVYELNKVFRNEGLDSTHHPEFTMLEFYSAYGDMYSMAEAVQHLFRGVCAQVSGTEESPYRHVTVDGTVLDFGGDWQWLSVYDGVSRAANVPVNADTSVEELQSLCGKHGVKYDDAWPAGKLVMELCSELVEPHLVQPTFLHDWPAEAQPLAARNPEDPRRVLAWDIIVNGTEMGCAFTELVDPVVQREVLTAQSLAAANGDPEAMNLDEDFLEALEYGAPPMGGAGLGVDRMVMLFTDSNIREAILFPLVRSLPRPQS